MDKSESPLLEQLRKFVGDNYQPERRLDKLLDKAKDLFKGCLAAKNEGTVPPEKLDAYCKQLLDGFAQECRWAKEWLREEHARNPVVSADTKIDYLKAWTEFIDKIYNWLKSAFKKGKADRIEYDRLKNLRDGLIEQGSVFYQVAAERYEADIEHYKGLLASGQRKDAGTKEGQKEAMSKSARALAVLKDHPDWTNKRIAEAAGMNEKSLYRNKDFCKAREILKSGKSNIPNGSKDAETGNIEAWEKPQ